MFNLVPAQGEPARFGFEVIGKIPIVIDTSVRTGRRLRRGRDRHERDPDRGAALSSQVTLWGVPGDPRHNQSRGWECVAAAHYAQAESRDKPCPTSTSLPQTPFLTLPTLVRRRTPRANR